MAPAKAAKPKAAVDDAELAPIRVKLAAGGKLTPKEKKVHPHG